MGKRYRLAECEVGLYRRVMQLDLDHLREQGSVIARGWVLGLWRDMVRKANMKTAEGFQPQEAEDRGRGDGEIQRGEGNQRGEAASHRRKRVHDLRNATRATATGVLAKVELP